MHALPSSSLFPARGSFVVALVLLAPLGGASQAGSTQARGAGQPAVLQPRRLPIDPLPEPDFSFAGWNAAAEEPPVVSEATHEVFDVTDYGAVANDGASDRAAIEAAIAASELVDGPVLIQFPPGRFVLRGPDEVGAESLRIRKSETVLQGAGMYSGGTELLLASESEGASGFHFQPDLDPSVGWRGAGVLTKLVGLPQRGSHEVQVVDPSALSVGSIVRLRGVLPDTFPEFRTFFDPLQDDAAIQGYFDDSIGEGADWRADFLSTLEIESITGDVVRFREPILAEYEFVSPTYDGGPEIVQIFADEDELLFGGGIEDLAFVADYRDNFRHFFNRAADGYNFVQLDDVRECFVRRVRMRGGTRGLVFESNGKNNAVYDVLFEGNSGHYSITFAGNLTGNQASFLREESPLHHGFGATSSAFGTVYHRCSQFGGPEGHGGYPQATLYDLNAGDLSLSRIGGAPPHLSKHTLFWNWEQALFLPADQALHGGDGRYLATALADFGLDVWPDQIMLPTLIGLHGIPLTIEDAAEDLELLLDQGFRVEPASLFEAQLERRLGAVPDWIAERAATFEAISRHTRIEIAAPGNDTVHPFGQSLSVSLRLPDAFDRSALARVELWESRGHELDTAPVSVASSVQTEVEELTWTPTEPGVWVLRLLLVNTLGEESWSEPVHIYVWEALDLVTYVQPVDAWLQPRSLDAREIASASASVVYTDAAQYEADVRALEEPLVQPDVDDAANHQVGLDLIDGDLETDATGPASLRFFGTKGLVLDLGADQALDFIELTGPAGSEDLALYGAFDVQVASARGSQYSYTNSDLSWRTVRRFGHARSSQRVQLDGQRTGRIFLPEGTEARFVRLVIRTLDSAGANTGNLSELRCGLVLGS